MPVTTVLLAAAAEAVGAELNELPPIMLMISNRHVSGYEDLVSSLTQWVPIVMEHRPQESFGASVLRLQGHMLRAFRNSCFDPDAALNELRSVQNETGVKLSRSLSFNYVPGPPLDPTVRLPDDVDIRWRDDDKPAPPAALRPGDRTRRFRSHCRGRVGRAGPSGRRADPSPRPQSARPRHRRQGRRIGHMLIVLDGIYSVGKSTTIELLRDRLVGESERPVIVSDWNSSSLVGDLIPQWKRGGKLGAQSLLLAEALDLAHRLEHTVLPCLGAGGTVIADRYVLSGMARSIIRGVDADLAAKTFAFAPKETLLVLVDSPSPVTLSRRRTLGKVLDGYHSGRDFRQTGGGVEADFLAYQDEMRDLYRALAAGRGPLTDVDTTVLSPAECVDRIMSALRDTTSAKPLASSVNTAS